MPRRKRTIKELTCPRDNAGLREIVVDVPGRDVRVDVCPSCGGMWLDAGELRRLTCDRRLSDYLTKDIGTRTSSPVVCPACGHLMDVERAEDVEVDVCLECRGVWLDTGELDGLKEAAADGFEGDADAKEDELNEESEARFRRRSRTLLGRIFG